MKHSTQASLAIKPLQEHHLPELYRLMVSQNFPHVPNNYEEAEDFFNTVYAFGAFEKSQLKVGFVFGDVTENSAFFDVVCAPNFQGKWATKGTLRQLYRLAFLDMALEFIWAQPHSKTALKAALQGGFLPATPLSDEVPVLILTRYGVHKKLRQNCH